MPPKNSNKATAFTATPATPETLEDVIRILTGLSNQFIAFNTKLDTVDITNNKITSMEAKLSALEAKLIISMNENKQLRAELTSKNKTIEDLQASFTGLEAKCNDLEQYNRSWSVRINNIPLTSEEEKSNSCVRAKVYTLALLPILQGAYNSGEISAIPTADQLLETAHVLPGKQGENKPVIARFYNREDKALCLRLKREHATRTPRKTVNEIAGGAVTGGAAAGGGRPEDRGWLTFPVQEDLTRINFLKMRAISKDPTVHSCWSINGSLRFRLKDSTIVKRVHSVFASVEAIISK
jgi:hypothetical protein